ncbi:thiamine diphosphokinase [bacterium 210820-DFI.6.37]|nr:thiamine diphosphokinase [bacterium 210820-DFI.6.37]
MKKCAIITSYIEGNLPDLMDGYEPDCILCADGGYNYAQAAEITPDYLIGDFDSLKGPLPSGMEILTYPAEKDDTDTGLCIQAALDMGCRDILILGGLGGRFDHSMANIQIMAGHVKEVDRIAIKDKKNYCTILCNGQLKLTKKSGQHVSILSLSDTSSGVSVSGLKYPLSDYTLTGTFPLGVSNEYEEDTALIRVKNGTLLIILSED